MRSWIGQNHCCVAWIACFWLASCTTGGDALPPFGAVGDGGETSAGGETGGAEPTETGSTDDVSGGAGAASGDDTDDPPDGTLDDGESPCVDALDCDDGVPCTADACDGDGTCTHAPDDTACDDGNACNGAETCDPDSGCAAGEPLQCAAPMGCSVQTCDPAVGACVDDDVVACIDGDGCCPAACDPSDDDDCTCTNIGPLATGSQSPGGGAGAYGPAAWVDGVEEHDCVPGCDECYGWVDNPEGSQGLTEFMQLEWDAPREIGSMYIATSDAVLTPCAPPGYPRNIDEGTVQYWDGVSWVDVVSFDGEHDDLWFDFDPPLQTVAIRVDGVRATPSLNPQIAPPGSSIVFEWYVYESSGCLPVLPPSP